MSRSDAPAPGFATRAIHHGFDPLHADRSLQPPVHLTSTYAFESVAAAEAEAAGLGRLYAREHNPTTALLERRLAALEGAEAAVAVASGMAAFGAMTLSLLSAGDRLIMHRTQYANTRAMALEGLPRFGIEVVHVDLKDMAALERELAAGARMVFFETPVNPTNELLDIAAIAVRAHARGALVAVDSTFASPALQNPIALGADLVMHSLTKYINGHGDALGGAVIGDAATIATVHDAGLRYITGAALSPLSAFLILRGLKTLDLRMQRHCENARIVAEALEAHPAVAWARWPGLESHPDHALCRAQMRGGSGMIAFGLHGGFEGARAMMDRLRLIALAVSLGDADSLITHPASRAAARRAAGLKASMTPGVSEDMMRLSVGLEDADDIVADLRAALDGL